MDVVAGPQQTPPRVSLLSSADVIAVEGKKWESGFVADLDGYGEVHTTEVCDADDLEIDSAEGGVASFKPYGLYATNRSSTFGDDASITEFYDKAQRKLIANESTVLESILWDGYAGTLNQNPYLSDGGEEYVNEAGFNDDCADLVAVQTITSGATSVQDAFAVLEQQIGEASANRGMIHLRPMALHGLVEADVVRREGNIWLSPMDNIVVPGRGYPGTGPAGQAVGATEWMYGHPGIVQVRHSEIIRLGEADKASQYYRGWNDHEVIVQRLAHVLLDPYAPVFAIDFESLGSFGAGPSVVYGGIDVNGGESAEVETTTIYGWNFYNTGGSEGAVTITLQPSGDPIVINLAAGESVTFFFPSPVGVESVDYNADADIEGTIFIAPA